jgi:hypothetical protein
MIRRWIRSGDLRASKPSSQHMSEPADHEEAQAAEELPIPESWGVPITGRPLPNIVAIVRGQRAEH